MNYAILCLPINGEPIFHHLYEWTGPHFIAFYSKVIETGESIAKKGKKFKKKLFSEEKSIKKHQEDSVKSYYSSARSGEENLHNSYSQKDKESLRQILKKHKRNIQKSN